MTHRRTALVSFAIALTLAAAAAPCSAQDIFLSVRGGRATLLADKAPLSAILTEWARVTGTTIVNGDTLDPSPVTLTLVYVPEREALATLLRNAPGYVLVNRAENSAAPPGIERIVIVPPGSRSTTASVFSPPRQVASIAEPAYAAPPVHQSDVTGDFPRASEGVAVRSAGEQNNGATSEGAHAGRRDFAPAAVFYVDGVTPESLVDADGNATRRPTAVLGEQPAAASKPGTARPSAPSTPRGGSADFSRPGAITPVPAASGSGTSNPE